jgi:hypothetical protein
MALIPKAGEDSPHTGIIRINWEIFPTDSSGNYANNLPVDIGVILFRTDSMSFSDCQNKIEALLKNNTENENFIHIWKRGSYI